MGKFLWFIFIVLLIWTGLGLWVFYGTELAGELGFLETIFKSPVILFNFAKDWVLGL